MKDTCYLSIKHSECIESQSRNIFYEKKSLEIGL